MPERAISMRPLLCRSVIDVLFRVQEWALSRWDSRLSLAWHYAFCLSFPLNRPIVMPAYIYLSMTRLWSYRRVHRLDRLSANKPANPPVFNNLKVRLGLARLFLLIAHVTYHVDESSTFAVTPLGQLTGLRSFGILINVGDSAIHDRTGWL